MFIYCQINRWCCGMSKAETIHFDEIEFVILYEIIRLFLKQHIVLNINTSLEGFPIMPNSQTFFGECGITIQIEQDKRKKVVNLLHQPVQVQVVAEYQTRYVEMLEKIHLPCWRPMVKGPARYQKYDFEEWAVIDRLLCWHHIQNVGNSNRWTLWVLNYLEYTRYILIYFYFSTSLLDSSIKEDSGSLSYIINTVVADYNQWPLLLTWINFNPSMDK